MSVSRRTFAADWTINE